MRIERYHVPEAAGGNSFVRRGQKMHEASSAEVPNYKFRGVKKTAGSEEARRKGPLARRHAH